MGEDLLPILDHATAEPSAFTPQQLIEDLRRIRGVPQGAIPAVCILEFDGDITDWLLGQGMATPVASWACFHTTMFAGELEGTGCGIIARTIGGPYAVLIAEQLPAAGGQPHSAVVKLIVGLPSAGRVAPSLPLPCLVVATAPVRDEGISYHYLAPGAEVACPTQVASHLERELATTGWRVRTGTVWTTDAPYRETRNQLEKWARGGALAVEMQTASLFAFGAAQQAPVASVAMVSNAIDNAGEQFDTGSPHDGLRILKAIARAARSYLGR